MTKDWKGPGTGDKHDEMAEQIAQRAEVAASDADLARAHDAGSRSATDRRVEGLLRIIGLQYGNDRELTEEEAELIFDLAEAEPVSEERLARIREGVLRRRFGTTPVAAESSTEASPVVASSIAEAHVASVKAPSWADGDSWRVVPIPYPDATHPAPVAVTDWKALVAELVDDAECRYDHHGYCQSHRLDPKPCPHERATAALRAAQGEGR